MENKKYNYIESMEKDIVAYLEKHKDILEKYNVVLECVDDLCIDTDFLDEVTGSDGTYAENETVAEGYLKGNMDLFVEATKEFGFNWDAIENLSDIDVAIRLDLIGQATSKALVDYFVDYFEEYD